MDRVEELIERISSLNDEIEEYKIKNGVDQNLKAIGHKFDELCEELAKTKDQRGLLYLLDYFDEEFDDKYEGVLEVLQNAIFDNYSYDRIIEAFYEKFDRLLHKNQWRAECISRNFFDSDEDFEKFRDMFNAVKSVKSKEFLDSLETWLDSSYDVGLEGVEILREDMKKW